MKCSCGENYDRIAQHWAFNPSHRPTLSDKQWEICVGLLLGDGCLVDDASEGALVVGTKNEEFLSWLDEELGWLSGGYTEQSNGMFRLRTVAHPELTELRGWYWTGEKEFPPELELTPIMFEMWYVGDGTLESRDETRQSRLRMSCAQDEDVVDDILSSIPIDVEYSRNENPWGCSYVFSVDSSKDLWSWMPYDSVGYDRKFPGTDG